MLVVEVHVPVHREVHGALVLGDRTEEEQDALVLHRFAFFVQLEGNNLLVAGWFVVFSVPFMLWVHEDKSRVSRPGKIVTEAYAQLLSTFKEIRKYRQTLRFLIAHLIYNDGLVTIFAFGGIYAAATFGFTLEKVLLFGIVVNVFAGAGAVAMGYLDDRIGAKRTLSISLLGLIIATLLAMA